PRFVLVLILPLLVPMRVLSRMLPGAGAKHRRTPALPDLLCALSRILPASADVRIDGAYGLRDGNGVRECSHFPRRSNLWNGGGIFLLILHAAVEAKWDRC